MRRQVPKAGRRLPTRLANEAADRKLSADVELVDGVRYGMDDRGFLITACVICSPPFTPEAANAAMLEPERAREWLAPALQFDAVRDEFVCSEAEHTDFYARLADEHRARGWPMDIPQPLRRSEIEKLPTEHARQAAQHVADEYERAAFAAAGRVVCTK